MNIIDAVVILLILLAGVVGLKRGFFQQVVMTVGVLIVVVLAFYLKNPVADFFCSIFPFFNSLGAFKGGVILNIILYQLIAFLLVLVILLGILNILVRITGVFEKALNFTIILGIPSKILGFIVGIIEGYVIIFVALFFLNQPAVNLEIVQGSKLMPKILNSTPGLTQIASNMNSTIQDIYQLKDDLGDGSDANQFNLDALDVMLKHGIVKVESIEKLLQQGKLNGITGVDAVLNRYR